MAKIDIEVLKSVIPFFESRADKDDYMRGAADAYKAILRRLEEEPDVIQTKH